MSTWIVHYYCFLWWRQIKSFLEDILWNKLETKLLFLLLVIPKLMAKYRLLITLLSTLLRAFLKKNLKYILSSLITVPFTPSPKVSLFQVVYMASTHHMLLLIYYHYQKHHLYQVSRVLSIGHLAKRRFAKCWGEDTRQIPSLHKHDKFILKLLLPWPSFETMNMVVHNMINLFWRCMKQ